MPKILITGAGGFVGAELVRYFAAKNWEVVGLVRQPERYATSKHVRYEAYDLLTSPDESLFKKADYLVHTAYAKYDNRHPDALRINKEAAISLRDAARKHKLKKMVFMSSMSAHEAAVSVYGKQKLAIEKLLDGPREVSLRSGLSVGPGGIVRQMAEFMQQKHMVPLISGGRQPLQTIWVRDLARSIERALTTNVHGVLTVAHPQVHTYKQFYQAIARTLKIKVLFVPVPFYLLLGIFRLISLLPIPLSVGEDNLWGLKKLRAVDTTADLAKLGVTLEPLEKTLRQPGVLTE